jgi:molybdate transport system ATP-binding protein
MSVLKAEILLERSSFTLDINCTVSARVTGIFGPSGAGKTTFLHALAGIQTPSKGAISICGKEVFDKSKKINLPPEKRNIGFVFQEARLFPHMNVTQNLRYGLKNKKDSSFFRQVTEMLRITDILKSKTSKISGGQAQRVAIGRALLTRPDLLVLDEPFSALDKNLRLHIISMLKPLFSSFNLPVLVISHDLGDLLMLTDNLLIIKAGKCIGQGNYYDLIDKKEMMGEFNKSGLINAIPLKIDFIDGDKGLMTLSHGKNMVFAESWLDGEKFIDNNQVTAALRPEDVTLATHRIEDISIQNQIEGKIIKLITMENKVFCVIDHGFRLIAEVSLAAKQKMQLHEGMTIWSLFKAAAIKVNTPGIVNSTDL